MPYNKNKQQAFQAAQQGTHQAKDIYENMQQGSNDYGHQLKHLKNEINEAYQQIENALEVSSEGQVDQLRQFKNDLESLVDNVNME